MNKAFLLTGGNLGNRAATLSLAAERIEESCGTVLHRSPLYETEAWGKTGQPAFLNQALELDTLLEPEALMITLLQIEESMGRRREEKYGPRTIDIDILFYNDLIMDSTLLHVPHPALHLRRFALEPLASIAPGLIHPLLKKDIATLLAECPDPLAVKKI